MQDLFQAAFTQYHSLTWPVFIQAAPISLARNISSTARNRHLSWRMTIQAAMISSEQINHVDDSYGRSNDAPTELCKQPQVRQIG